MLSGEGNAGERSKTTLHVQHPFFVHFFTVVLHDYNAKLPETFLMEEMSYASRSQIFSLRLIFSLH